MSLKGVFFSALVVLSSLLTEGKDFRVVEDLESQWKIFSNGKLVNPNKDFFTAVHISLDLGQAQGHYLQLGSRSDFYFFINAALAVKGSHQLTLSADSLKKIYGPAIFVSIFQKKGIDDLSMKWVVEETPDSLYNPQLPSRAFSNFALIGSLILIIFFTGLFRTNPQLTLDYLNIGKLFYFKDRDDNQITLRIASSVNLLFYLFCGLLAALALISAAKLSGGRMTFLGLSALSSTGQYIGKWLLLAFAIVGLLMLKFAFASLMSLLFGWRDGAGFQFFNFIRVVILTLVFIACASIFGFAVGINFEYFSLLKIGCLLLISGTGLLYFKLLARNPFHSFHLFSYLCVTEIFPLMILIKLILF